MVDIVTSIYDMMHGKFTDPFIHEHTAKEHVEEVFKV